MTKKMFVVDEDLLDIYSYRLFQLEVTNMLTIIVNNEYVYLK